MATNPQTPLTVARAGKPVARLTKLEPKKSKIRFGGLKGRIQVADDFDAPLPPEVLAEFESDIFPPESGLNDESQAESPKKSA